MFGFLSGFIYKIDIYNFLFWNGFAGRAEWLDNLIILLAVYLPFVLPVFLAVLVYRTKNGVQEKLLLISAPIVAGAFARFAVVELIRFFYHRPRPFLVLNFKSLFVENSFSFPSAHAAFFFAFSFTIFLYNRKWGIGFLIASLLITVARVAAGVHYPSDIVAGAFVGAVVATIFTNLAFSKLPKSIGFNIALIK